MFPELGQGLLVARLVEVLAQRPGDRRAEARHGGDLLPRRRLQSAKRWEVLYQKLGRDVADVADAEREHDAGERLPL